MMLGPAKNWTRANTEVLIFFIGQADRQKKNRTHGYPGGN